MNTYGLTSSQWESAKGEIRRTMTTTARAQNTISYSEVVADVSTVRLEADGQALAHILGEISTEEAGAGRGMLSVVVVHKGGDLRPGPGFFNLAERLGRDVMDKERCWIEELNLVYGSVQ